ncbi:MAG: tRNA glutamyl-Q(34) synthetase GluQRS [Burkholderiaceae bacterium]
MMTTSSPAGRYIGRFAPSPTGPLHEGSIVAALASWLDARAHDGRWLLRIEDIDPPRELAGASELIVATLERLGMRADEPALLQSSRLDAHLAAIAALRMRGRVYDCSCSRREIRERLIELGRLGGNESPGEAGPPYPGTCRNGPTRKRDRSTLRYRVDDRVVEWADRPAGHDGGRLQRESLALTCGDFPLRRADGLISYQLAVVVDDGAAGITDVVRGADLVTSTARQHDLADSLGLPRPRSLHIPVLTDADGTKLSKQTGAPAVLAHEDLDGRIAILNRALGHLELKAVVAGSLAQWQAGAIERWRQSRWFAS